MGRTELLRWKSKDGLEVEGLLHLAFGASSSPKYLIGKEGWFFHRESHAMLEQVRGAERFSRVSRPSS